MAPEPFAAPAPVTEDVAPAPADTCATHPVIEYVAPSPVIGYIARAPAATCSAPSQQFPPAYTMAAVTTGVNLDTTDLVNPQCSVTAVEDSAPQAIDSCSPSDEFAAPVYNQARQELFVAEETTQNKVEIPTVHEPVVDGLSSLKDLGAQMEHIELLADQAAKRAMTMMQPP